MSEQKRVLTDQELEQTAGGESLVPKKPVYNKFNDLVGRIDPKGNIEYYACYCCGRPLHRTPHGWACTPCQRYFNGMQVKYWDGTIEQLKAASEVTEIEQMF